MTQIQRNINEILILHEELLGAIHPIISRAATKASDFLGPGLLKPRGTSHGRADSFDYARGKNQAITRAIDSPLSSEISRPGLGIFTIAEPSEAAEISIIFVDLVCVYYKAAYYF